VRGTVSRGAAGSGAQGGGREEPQWSGDTRCTRIWGTGEEEGEGEQPMGVTQLKGHTAPSTHCVGWSLWCLQHCLSFVQSRLCSKTCEGRLHLLSREEATVSEGQICCV